MKKAKKGKAGIKKTGSKRGRQINSRKRKDSSIASKLNSGEYNANSLINQINQLNLNENPEEQRGRQQEPKNDLIRR